MSKATTVNIDPGTRLRISDARKIAKTLGVELGEIDLPEVTIHGE